MPGDAGLPLACLQPMSKRILFLCVKNSSRSQMAEALLRMTGLDVEVHSAGLRPAAEVNPTAVKAMQELDYDLAAHRPKHVCEVQEITFDMVVKMDVPEPEICDQVSAKWIESWDIPDPAKGGLEEFRKVRDLLAERIARTFAKTHERKYA
jgi:arsenate reductase (thioredoxin)